MVCVQQPFMNCAVFIVPSTGSRAKHVNSIHMYRRVQFYKNGKSCFNVKLEGMFKIHSKGIKRIVKRSAKHFTPSSESATCVIIYYTSYHCCSPDHRYFHYLDLLCFNWFDIAYYRKVLVLEKIL